MSAVDSRTGLPNLGVQRPVPARPPARRGVRTAAIFSSWPDAQQRVKVVGVYIDQVDADVQAALAAGKLTPQQGKSWTTLTDGWRAFATDALNPSTFQTLFAHPGDIESTANDFQARAVTYETTIAKAGGTVTAPVPSPTGGNDPFSPGGAIASGFAGLLSLVKYLVVGACVVVVAVPLLRARGAK